MFSSHSGAPTDRKLSDNDPELFAVQKAQRAPLMRFQEVSLFTLRPPKCGIFGCHCRIDGFGRLWTRIIPSLNSPKPVKSRVIFSHLVLFVGSSCLGSIIRRLMTILLCRWQRPRIWEPYLNSDGRHCAGSQGTSKGVSNRRWSPGSFGTNHHHSDLANLLIDTDLARFSHCR